MASARITLFALACLQLVATTRARTHAFLKVHNVSETSGKSGNLMEEVTSDNENADLSDLISGDQVLLFANSENASLELSKEEAIEENATVFKEKADFDAVTQELQDEENKNKDAEKDDATRVADVDIDEEAKEIQDEDAQVLAEGGQAAGRASGKDVKKQLEAKVAPQPLGKLATKKDQSALSIASAVEQHDDIGEGDLRLWNLVRDWAHAMDSRKQTKERAEALRKAMQNEEEAVGMKIDEDSKEVLDEDAQAIAEGENDLRPAAAKGPNDKVDNHTRVSSPSNGGGSHVDLSRTSDQKNKNVTAKFVQNSTGHSVIAIARKAHRVGATNTDDYEDDGAQGGASYIRVDEEETQSNEDNEADSQDGEGAQGDAAEDDGSGEEQTGDAEHDDDSNDSAENEDSGSQEQNAEDDEDTDE